MRFPFGLKLGLAISTLAVGVTTSAVTIFYLNTKETVLNQMKRRLLDVGHTGSFLFGPEERAAIYSIRARVLDGSADRTERMQSMEPGDFGESLPPSLRDEIQESPAFLRLVQVLRTIRAGSSTLIEPLREYDENVPEDDAKPDINFAYLYAPIPESPDYSTVVMLADTNFIPVDEDGDGVISADEEANPTGNLYSPPRDRPAFWQPFQTGNMHVTRNWYGDQWGTFLSAAIPIKDAEGNVIAVLGLDYLVTSEANKLEALLYLCVGLIAASLVLSVGVAFFLAYLMNRPIQKLREGAERVRERDFSTQIEVKTSDEFGLLANTFNGMVTEIREYAQGLEDLSQAYYRFVPREFLEYLERKSIIDVQLGDQVQREMTVFFSDIRSFTTLSERMTPADNFNFLNSYLGTVSPIIRKNHGFIDKYIGDAVMALFPTDVNDAIKCSVDVHAELRDYNQSRLGSGQLPVNIGVGLHNGKLMLGTVGERKRMEGTVISDAVNLASRLEGLTKKFGCRVLVSEQVIKDSHGNFESRFLGRVRVKGKAVAIKVFEILDADTNEEKAKKIDTRVDFENAVHIFQSGRFGDAMAAFEQVIKRNPDDPTAQVYISRCRGLSRAS